MYITVFTATYNRAYILERLYNSLKAQTDQGFEWLIVDDGSTDDTKLLTEKWMSEDISFKIRYYRQSNGGKCRAINTGLDLANGEMFLVVDSDDYLVEDAIKRVKSWEIQISDKEGYCGVSGNLGTDKETTENHLFEDGYYEGTLLDRYRNIDGERAFAFYTEIHRKYKYPEFDGEKFITEAVAYNRMANDGYRMRFYNDIICVYEYQENGLTKSGAALFLDNPRGYGLWLREKAEFLSYSLKDKIRMWYTFFCDECVSRPEKRISKKECAECIGAPFICIGLLSVLHGLKGLFRHDEH